MLRAKRRFREERGTIENVPMMNHVISKETKKKGGKGIAYFVDLKATFDNVERGEVWEVIVKREMSNKLRKRIAGLYKKK